MKRCGGFTLVDVHLLTVHPSYLAIFTVLLTGERTKASVDKIFKNLLPVIRGIMYGLWLE